MRTRWGRGERAVLPEVSGICVRIFAVLAEILSVFFAVFVMEASAAEPKAIGAAYSEALIEQTALKHGLRRDENPEGKRIERIVIVPYDVFLESDPWPNFLNWFHSTTRDRIVRRELLFKEGDPWVADRVDETSRNLRANLQLFTAAISSWQGSSPDKIVALVVTKDLWSFRPGLTLTVVGTTLQYLELQVTEQNLFGERKTAGFDFGLDPYVQWAGLQLREPRLLSSRVSVGGRADVIWNRYSSVFEGGLANLFVEQPLFSLDTPWAWGLYADYRKDVYRLFTSQGENSAQVQAELPQTGVSVPFDYRRYRLDLRAQLTRSTGHLNKTVLMFGWKGTSKQAQLYQDAAVYGAAPLGEFASLYLPRTEDLGMAFFSFRKFRAEYRQLVDVDRYAITEDWQIGPDVFGELRVATPALGGNSTFAEANSRASWTFDFGGDLLRLAATGAVRYQPEVMQQQGLSMPWVNEVVSLSIKNVTPQFGPFRLFTGARLVRRWNDMDKGLEILGGDGALRGFAQASFYGLQSWGANTEIRTVPWVIKTLHLGAVAFVDSGDAYYYPQDIGVHASAGVGARISLPQFNRTILRMDLGFPFVGVTNTSYFVATFDQAF